MSSGKKTSTIEEDFESLFVEEEENTKDNNFNDLFEKISEESVEPVKESSVSEKEITENIEEDFDALLDDETLQCVKDEVTDSKNSKSITKEVDSNHGFSQIFSSNSSDDATNDDKDKADEVDDMKTLATSNESLEKENNRLRMQIAERDKEIKNLAYDIKELRKKQLSVDSEKEKLENQIKALKVTEENLLEEVHEANERNKSQEELIEQLKAKIGNLEVENSTTRVEKVPTTDPTKTIKLLENELEDQKEVSNKLKAYVGEVLENVIGAYPEVLERK